MQHFGKYYRLGGKQLATTPLRWGIPVKEMKINLGIYAHRWFYNWKYAPLSLVLRDKPVAILFFTYLLKPLTL